jgi:hypothetical protein
MAVAIIGIVENYLRLIKKELLQLRMEEVGKIGMKI